MANRMPVRMPVCRNSGLLPALLQGKKVFSQFSASHADFYLILLNERFRLFPARLRCFQQYVSENRLFLSFLPKLRFWPFILPKPSFGLVATELEASSFMSQKAAISLFARKHAVLSFIRTEPKTCFVFFATKLEAWSLITQKNSNLVSWLQNALLQPS